MSRCCFFGSYFAILVILNQNGVATFYKYYLRCSIIKYKRFMWFITAPVKYIEYVGSVTTGHSHSQQLVIVVGLTLPHAATLCRPIPSSTQVWPVFRWLIVGTTPLWQLVQFPHNFCPNDHHAYVFAGNWSGVN